MTIEDRRLRLNWMYHHISIRFLKLIDDLDAIRVLRDRTPPEKLDLVGRLEMDFKSLDGIAKELDEYDREGLRGGPEVASSDFAAPDGVIQSVTETANELGDCPF